MATDCENSGDTATNTVLETDSAEEFKKFFENDQKNQAITFQTTSLSETLKTISSGPISSRKVLVLYFHNAADKFSRTFFDSLKQSEAQKTIREKFLLLGWNVAEDRYATCLQKALEQVPELSILVQFLETKTCAAFFVVPVNDSIVLLSMVAGKVREKDVVTTVKNAEDFLINENVGDEGFDMIDADQDVIDSKQFQQLICDRMGDRDYDSFDHNELHLLKDKIGYALYGPPKETTGYDAKCQKRIQSLFDVILEESNRISKWKDRVLIAFLYNCCEPLPSTKVSRASQYHDYDPRTDLNPIPVFVLRKCKNVPPPPPPPVLLATDDDESHGLDRVDARPYHQSNGKQACRVIVDHVGRVYATWQAYVTGNKLHQCQMVLPLDGRYGNDERGAVRLERHLSPACGLTSKIVKGTDVASTVAGLVSGGIVLTSAVAILPVAPVAVVAAAITGLGVGLYSLARSAVTLHDRKVHKESLSFANSEARGAYINMITGSLGFVGAGTNVAVSHLVSLGYNIGQNTTAAISVVNYASLGATGVEMVNSSYDIFDQMITHKQAPSPLSVLRLSTSILFFGHAVYNFKHANVLVEQTQARVLEEYHRLMRRNSLQKPFNQLQKDVLRQCGGDLRRSNAQVIKTLRSIRTGEELQSLLCQSETFSSTASGDLKLNGVQVDLHNVMVIDKCESVTFMATVHNSIEPSPHDIASWTTKLYQSFGTCLEFGQIVLGIAQLFHHTHEAVKDKVINLVAHLTMEILPKEPILDELLGEIFPGHRKVFEMIKMVNGYFQKFVDEYETGYQRWLLCKPSQDPNETIYKSFAQDYSERVIQIFEIVTEAYFLGTQPTASGIGKILEYLYTWLAKEYVTHEENLRRKEERKEYAVVPNVKVKCDVCCGEYYRKPNTKNNKK